MLFPSGDNTYRYRHSVFTAATWLLAKWQSLLLLSSNPHVAVRFVAISLQQRNYPAEQS